MRAMMPGHNQPSRNRARPPWAPLIQARPAGARLPSWCVKFLCAAWLAVLVRAEPAAPVTPDLDAILARVVASAAQDHDMEARFRASHAFVRTKVTDTLDGEGVVKKRESVTERHTPHAQATAPGLDDRSAAESASRRSRRAYERRDFEVTRAWLKRFEFTLAGRELLNGREAWVVDFKPAADQPPVSGVKEKFLSRTAGRFWVDTGDGWLARIQFRLIEPVTVAGGLVGALKHCEVAIRRERTASGVWFTRLLEWQIEGRALFSRRLMAHREDVTDVSAASGTTVTAAN